MELADRFDNSYARLPEHFYKKLPPAKVAEPAAIKVNARVAATLNLDPDWLASDEGLAMLAGNFVPDGADPLAMAYAGHQFGGWSPQLGDGRAILLGELLSGNGERYDLQLKGSGRTPFSRGGDGRAWLGPVLREYVVSEAMHALGIPTTHALAAVTTGETVMREGAMPGAVLTRVAKSHIRIGTFEYFAARGDTEALQQLSDYVIDRFYPHSKDEEDPVLSLLKSVLERQAALVSQWQWVGFIHGVMNTDNMNISGETIDYGPCAFLDEYEAGKKFSSIDHQGRYAYANQPRIAQWNLAVLAQSLLPLLGSETEEEKAIEKAQSVIDSFPAIYQQAYINGMRKKLGLPGEQEEDLLLGSELLEHMEAGKADFTLVFRGLYDHARLLQSASVQTASADNESAYAKSRENLFDLFDTVEGIDHWLTQWLSRISTSNSSPATSSEDKQSLEQMRASNPAVIPRNHKIEEAIQESVEQGSYQLFEQLLKACSDPFADNDENDPVRQELMMPPSGQQRVTQTFCGT